VPQFINEAQEVPLPRDIEMNKSQEINQGMYQDSTGLFRKRKVLRIELELMMFLPQSGLWIL
jgi:hypothetical protein